jgi:hypothetical protein
MASNLLLNSCIHAGPTESKEHSMAENNQEDWRELCAAAAKEPDSDKLFSLVNQILEAFDDLQKPTTPVESMD